MPFIDFPLLLSEWMAFSAARSAGDPILINGLAVPTLRRMEGVGCQTTNQGICTPEGALVTTSKQGWRVEDHGSHPPRASLMT
jgi:hypothetical protein